MFTVLAHAVTRAKERIPECKQMDCRSIREWIMTHLDNAIEIGGQRKGKALKIPNGIAIVMGDRVVTVYDDAMYAQNCREFAERTNLIARSRHVPRKIRKGLAEAFALIEAEKHAT